MYGDDPQPLDGGDSRPGDLALAWDAMDRHAVRLLWQALPEVRSVRPPGEELHAAAEVIRSNRRRWPYRQLAKRAWRRARPPADDTELWLDATAAMATIDNHLDTDLRTLGVLALLRPADWAGAVIGMIRAGIGVPVTGADLVRYVRECPEIAGGQEPGGDALPDAPADHAAVPYDRFYDTGAPLYDTGGPLYDTGGPVCDPGGQAGGAGGPAYGPDERGYGATAQADGADAPAYDPFASGADDQALAQAFEAALYCCAAVGAVNEQWWLTPLGWWGLPRALARAWNGDFDAAGWAGADEDDLPQATWRGGAVSPAELGIIRPPPVF